MAFRFAPSVAFTKSVLGSHSWLGLIFGALIYQVCVSGTLSVLLDEFTLWEAPHAPRVQIASPEQLARVAQEVYVKAKAQGLNQNIVISAPTPTRPWLRVFAQGPHSDSGPQSSRQWLVDAQDRLHSPVPAPWSEFLRANHDRLHVPAPWGTYAVGIVGTLLLASLISGLLAHRRIVRDAFRLRRGGSRRLSNADLHNRIGVWALPFHLIVSLTGSLLGLAGLIIGALALVAYGGDGEKAVAALLGPQPSGLHTPAPLPDIAPMMRFILEQTPDVTLTEVSYLQVGTTGQVVSIHTTAPGHLAGNETWTFDGQGRLLSKAGITDGTVGIRLYGVIAPLHFGTYGGLALKLIYVALGTGLCVVAAAGINMWLARQRERGRPAPRSERLWAAWVWGQIPAYAAVALTALAADGAGSMVSVSGLLAVYWVVTLGLCVLALPVADDRAVARRVRTAGGVMLALTAVGHWALRPDLTLASALPNTALLMGAAALLWGPLRARIRPETGVRS